MPVFGSNISPVYFDKISQFIEFVTLLFLEIVNKFIYVDDYAVVYKNK